MSYLIGTFVGAIIGVYVISQLLEWVIFKRVFDDPVYGKLTSVSSAWLVAVTVYTWTNGGDPYRPIGFAILTYTLAALLVGFFAYRRGEKLREEMEYGDASTDEIEDVFK